MMSDVNDHDNDNDASASQQGADVVNAREETRKRALLEQPEEIKPEWLELPENLKDVDFTQRVSWGKYAPYNNPGQNQLDLVPLDTPPIFTEQSPALCHQVHAICGRARACTVHLSPKDEEGNTLERPPVPTPRFMPVGTKGTLKGVLPSEIEDLNCPIILGNTYHLAIQPGTSLIQEHGGLHRFMGGAFKNKRNYNLLTDSGGFQMVSLAALSQVTEEGVVFENPYNKNKRETLLLRPEDSIQYQNEIGADIIMALDDVISSVAVNDERFKIATYRTLRWYDRCLEAHKRKQVQNLFPIVQGALDTQVGGLREQCLAGFRLRDVHAPGYAIGGLAGGESKDEFWRVVDQCCKALPDTKPRYLMGVGYPLDLIVCTSLGVDMYDCVYPTRTARFGVALVPGPAPGTLKLKAHVCATQNEIIQQGCSCPACSRGVTRARIHALLKSQNTLAIQLLTQHNVCYMMKLVNDMRQAVLDQTFPTFVRTFIRDQFRGGNDGQPVPQWVQDALQEAGISLLQDQPSQEEVK
jgi:tRNA-guanine transglycosylase